MKNKNTLIEFLESPDFKELQTSLREVEDDNLALGKLLHTKELEKYILSTIIIAEKEECSYRYLIYTSLDAGMGSYMPLQLAGLLDMHNKFYDDESYLSEYKLDLSGKETYAKLTENEKIAIISFSIQSYKEK